MQLMEGVSVSENLDRIFDGVQIDTTRNQFKHGVYSKRARRLGVLEVRDFIRGLAGLEGVKNKDIVEYLDEDSSVEALIADWKDKKKSKKVQAEIDKLCSLWCLSYKAGETMCELFFDPQTNKELDIFTKNAFREELSKYLDKEESAEMFQKWFRANHKSVSPVYFRSYQKFFDTDYGFQEYNLYNVPAYRELPANPDNPKLQVFFKFIAKLFPNQDHRMKVLEWTTASLFKRQDLALCLIGLQGTGKTLFSKIVMGLHGKSNSFSVSGMASGFNEYLKNKTIILFDEAKIDQAQNEAFKREMNEYVGIQEKFKNQKEIKNECSIILAANYHKNLYLTPNDRRFFLPDMATEKIQEYGFTQEELEIIFELDTDDYFLAALYDLLLEEFPEASKEQMQMYVTPGFERACLLSAPAFYRKTLSMLTEKDHNGNYTYEYVEYQQVQMEAMRLAERRMLAAGELPSESEWLNSIVDYWVDCEKKICVDRSNSAAYLRGNYTPSSDSISKNLIGEF